jgi:hypothetical protein
MIGRLINFFKHRKVRYGIETNGRVTTSVTICPFGETSEKMGIRMTGSIGCKGCDQFISIDTEKQVVTCKR